MTDQRRWTSDDLLNERAGERGTATYAAGYRATLRRMADDVGALVREYHGDLAGQRLEHDRPWDPRVRAWRAARPLVQLEKHLRAALVEIGRLDAAYERLFVSAPAKRRAIMAAKAARRQRRLGIASGAQRPAITGPGPVHQLGQELAEDQGGGSFLGLLGQGQGQGQQAQGDAYRRQA